MSRLIDKLRERLEQNFIDFREVLISTDCETVFAHAKQISAMEDVIFYMNVFDWLDESDIAYLLDFTEPLMLIADAWEEHLDTVDKSFRFVLKAALDSDENEEKYITVALERELQEKYGEDVNVRDAMLAEIVELESRLQELREECECLEGEYWDEE